MAARDMKPASHVLALCTLLASACSGATGPSDAAADVRSTDVAMCTAVPPVPDSHDAQRAACAFAAGSHAADTLDMAGVSQARTALTHVVIVVQENRSFDHYFGALSTSTQPDAEPLPSRYTNPDSADASVAPFHLPTPCLPTDPGHQWESMHAAWNEGAMDGFVRNADVTTGGIDHGRFAVGYYTADDLPFYYWLAGTYALADHYFASALGGTWANRDYLYAGSSYGVHSTAEATIAGHPTVFDALDAADVTWGVFTDGNPRQDCLGWSAMHRGLAGFDTFLTRLGDGSLPAVSFVDPGPSQDEHPPNDVQHGEAWTRAIHQAAVSSPLWDHLAVFFTYDEGGALFDHVPPPAACLASSDQTGFDRLGMRVPLIVISPWARAHTVSHRVHEHASVLRFVEALFDLPALTARDANADAMLDLFDFACPQLAHPPAAPAAGSAPACP